MGVRYFRHPLFSTLFSLFSGYFPLISCGITSKGPCRSSKTKGISNEFLARQGLISLKDLWINIYYSS